MKYRDLIHLSKTAGSILEPTYHNNSIFDPQQRNNSISVDPYPIGTAKPPETVSITRPDLEGVKEDSRRQGLAEATEAAIENRFGAGIAGATIGGAAGLLAGILFGSARKDKRLRNAIKYGLIGGGAGALAGNMLGRAYGPIA